ncbi:MAG: hypothetical protein V1668_01015 [Patescibacteria group bacterium]
MDNLNVNSANQDSDLPAGFLIKDKSGQFKKVLDDKITDFSVKKATVTPPPQPQRVLPVRPPVVSPQPGIPPLREAVPIKAAPPISSSPHASAFMAPDDEFEIHEQQAKLNQMVATPAGHSVLSVEEIVRAVISDFQLSFTDDVMQKRFGKVIESRLRDLRDSVETAEVLSRSKKIGGLEIPADQAAKIIQFVEKQISAQPVHKPIESVVAAMPKPDAPPAFIPRPQPVKPPPPAVPTATVKEDIGQLAEEIKKEIQKPLPKLKPQPAELSKPAPVSTPDMYTRPVDEMPRIVQVRQVEQARPQVNDIRRPARVMGPVEELADIDLDEFRRQGTNPAEAADRILEKIDLLEHDSWAVKVEAIKAWRQSPVSRLYLQIGRESMEENLAIAEIIRKRMQGNQPYLLLDEFLAINSLNSRLAV